MFVIFILVFFISISNPLLKFSSKLGLNNVTISTPPSELRKQINILRDEMAESHEFHDLEMKILEEKDSENYVQLIEKYSALLDLYTSLKKEYEDYRSEQEKVRDELQDKTANCLQNLCSQIEASDSSFTFNDISFTSLNNDVKSSTILENISENEISVANSTLLTTNDPLAISKIDVFKTPLTTPKRSVKKKLLQSLSSVKLKSLTKDNISFNMSKGDDLAYFNVEQNNKITNLQTMLQARILQVEELEKRLFKVEDLLPQLESQSDKIISDLKDENLQLKNDLSKKSDQLNDLTKKLITEIIDLNPSLKDSLNDYSATKILFLFIETIMDSCKNVQGETLEKWETEKSEWKKQKKADTDLIENLQNQSKILKNEMAGYEIELQSCKEEYDNLKLKYSEAETIIKKQDEEIRSLKFYESDNSKVHENLLKSEETIAKLQSDLSVLENEKTNIFNKYQELESKLVSMESEMKTKVDELVNINNLYNDSKLKNESFAQQLKVSEESTLKLQNDLELIRKELNCNDNKFSEEITHFKKENKDLKNIFTALMDNKITLSEFIANNTDLSDMGNSDSTQFFEQLKPIFRDCLENESERFLLIIIETIFSCCKFMQQKIAQDSDSEKNDSKSSENSNCILFNATENHVNFLKNEMDNCVRDLRHYKNLHDMLKIELFDFYSAITRQIEEIESRQSETFCKTQQITRELQMKLLIFAKERIDLENKYNELENKMKEKEGELETNTNLLDELKIENEELKQSLEKFKESVTLREIELDKITNELNCTQNKLSEEINSLKKENEEFRSLYAALINKKEIITEFFGEKYNYDEVFSESLSERLKPLSSSLISEKENEKLCLGVTETILSCCEFIRGKLKEINKKDEENLHKEKALVDDLNEKLKAEIETCKEELSACNVELNEYKENYESMKMKYSDVESEIVGCRVNLSSAEEKITQLENEILNLKNVKIELENKCTQLEDKLSILQSELNDKESNVQNANTLGVELKMENERLSKLVEKSEETISRLREELETIKSEAKNNDNRLSDDIGNLRKENQDLKNIFTVLRDCKTKISNACNEIFNLSSAEKINRDDFIETSRTIFEEILSENENKDSFLEIIDVVFDSCESIHKNFTDHLKKEFDNFENQKASLIDSVKDLQSQVENLKNDLGNCESELEKFKEENEILKQNGFEFESTISKLEKEIESLKFHESDKRKIQENLIQAQESIANLQAELSGKESEKVELVDKIKELNEKINELESEIKMKESEVEKWIKIHDELKVQNEKLSKILENSEKSIIELEKELKASKDELTWNDNKSYEEITLLKNEIEKMKNTISSLIRWKTSVAEMVAELSDIRDVDFSTYHEKIKSIPIEFSEKELNAEILSDCVQIIFNCCESLKLKLSADNDTRRENYESQKKIDDDLIENLRDEAKSLKDEIKNLEIELKRCSEVQNDFQVKFSNAEKIISNQEEEIRLLQLQNSELSKIREDLSSSEKIISNLKSEMEALVNEKKEIENKYNESIWKNETMASEIEKKEIELKNVNSFYDELKLGNEELTKLLRDSEGSMSHLEEQLEIVKKELSSSGDKFSEEITHLKKENSRLKHVFTVIVDKRTSLSELFSKVFNVNDLNDFESNKISDRIRPIFKNSLEDAESEKYLLNVAETIFTCCEYLERKIRKEKEMDREIFTKEKNSYENLVKDLNVRLESVNCEVEESKIKLREMESHKTKCTELFEKINENENVISRQKELLERKTDDFEELAKKVKILEENKKNLTDIILDVQSCLDMSDDTITKLTSGNFENRKILSESINVHIKLQMENLRIENSNLKMGSDNLKEKVKELSKMITDMSNRQLRDEMSSSSSLSTLNHSLSNSRVLRSSSGSGRSELCARRLDKLEETNQNLTELITRILTLTDFPNVEKVKFMSVREFPSTSKKIIGHIDGLLAEMKELKETNATLDEECESYAETIKEMKKEEVNVWKSNMEKLEKLESEKTCLNKEKTELEKERKNLLEKITKLENECQKLRAKTTSEGESSPPPIVYPLQCYTRTNLNKIFFFFSRRQCFFLRMR